MGFLARKVSTRTNLEVPIHLYARCQGHQQLEIANYQTLAYLDLVLGCPNFINRGALFLHNHDAICGEIMRTLSPFGVSRHGPPNNPPEWNGYVQDEY